MSAADEYPEAFDVQTSPAARTYALITIVIFFNSFPLLKSALPIILASLYSQALRLNNHLPGMSTLDVVPLLMLAIG